jgi:hypothetical protein
MMHKPLQLQRALCAGSPGPSVGEAYVKLVGTNYGLFGNQQTTPDLLLEGDPGIYCDSQICWTSMDLFFFLSKPSVIL